MGKGSSQHCPIFSVNRRKKGAKQAPTSLFRPICPHFPFSSCLVLKFPAEQTRAGEKRDRGEGGGHLLWRVSGGGGGKGGEIDVSLPSPWFPSKLRMQYSTFIPGKCAKFARSPLPLWGRNEIATTVRRGPLTKRRRPAKNIGWRKKIKREAKSKGENEGPWRVRDRYDVGRSFSKTNLCESEAEQETFCSEKKTNIGNNSRWS